MGSKETDTEMNNEATEAKKTKKTNDINESNLKGTIEDLGTNVHCNRQQNKAKFLFEDH